MDIFRINNEDADNNNDHDVKEVDTKESISDKLDKLSYKLGGSRLEALDQTDKRTEDKKKEFKQNLRNKIIPFVEEVKDEIEGAVILLQTKREKEDGETGTGISSVVAISGTGDDITAMYSALTSTVGSLLGSIVSSTVSGFTEEISSIDAMDEIEDEDFVGTQKDNEIKHCAIKFYKSMRRTMMVALSHELSLKTDVILTMLKYVTMFEKSKVYDSFSSVLTVNSYGNKHNLIKIKGLLNLLAEKEKFEHIIYCDRLVDELDVDIKEAKQHYFICLGMYKFLRPLLKSAINTINEIIMQGEDNEAD